MVIENQLQIVSGNAKIVAFSDDDVHPYSVVDLTPVYRGQADSTRRGVALLSSREVLVQDELTGLRPGSRVRWGMVTAGKPKDLGKSAVILRQGAEQLTLALVAPTDIGWNEIDTAMPQHEWDSPNVGTRMVTFEAKAPASGKLTLAVVATPGTCHSPVAGKLRIVPLEGWSQL